ncbi:MAG: isoprenyl transferase [Eggerthellaceae bacterium]|nr:isoprenyl transferase [Eggerthellaceae bacterium]MDR2721273.1 isoprenyl transferase [Coriobacteriaceae bacterium]
MHKALNDIFPAPPAGLDPAKLDTAHIPNHIAIIMDGNGRWANLRGKSRLMGHKAGIEAVRESIRCASDMGVRYLTIYSFSSENWKRPEDEVKGLMNLFAQTMLAEVKELHKEQVRVMTIGSSEELPKKTRDAFSAAWDMTKNNTGMTLVVAINYGARTEILDATKRLMNQAYDAAVAGQDKKMLSETLNEASFSEQLYTAAIPDPDLLIRTSGEMRVSNFLLWQIAYAEFVCTDVLWPDFDRYELLRSILEFQSRERRFGAL